jgi:hypothetical protein
LGLLYFYSLGESMIELWEILVPTVRRIGGKPYRTRYHRVWDTKVREIAGGLTILKPAKGQWQAPNGKLFAERMIPVRIACTREQIDQIADMSAIYYDQLAVMYYRVSNEVVIKNYAS